MRIRTLLGLSLSLGAIVLSGISASAQTVGYFGNEASGTPEDAITANGMTPVQIADINTFDFSTVDIVWLVNGSNSGYGDIPTRAGDLATFINGGGALILHDRRVTEAATVLPGAGGTTFVNNFDNDDDIDILTPTTVTNGPFGILNNTSLDGGNSSSHGFTVAGTLPGGSTAILNRGGAPGEIVDFTYVFGAGSVYYSTIPLDFYLSGGGNNPPGDALRDVYAPNVLAFISGNGGGGSAAPEPATLGLLALGGVGLIARRRMASK